MHQRTFRQVEPRPDCRRTPLAVEPDLPGTARRSVQRRILRRRQRGLKSDFLDQSADMQRAATAEGQQDEFLRVVPALDRNQANRSASMP